MKLDMIVASQLESYTWMGEYWQADISIQGAKIYDSDNPENFEIIELEKFKEIMMIWRKFIQSAPQAEATVEIEI
jgi:hypothetical protein